MAKVKLGYVNKKALYLHSTGVENMFINEFMPAAPGDYVKLYLYGLMMVQNEMSFEMKDLAQTMGMTIEEINRGWEYWAKNGLVKLLTDDVAGREIVGISFVRLPEYYYGSNVANKTEKSPEENTTKDDNPIDEDQERINRMMNTVISGLFNQFEEACGRTISKRETGIIVDAIKVYDVSPDVFGYAIKYCAELEKNNIEYINKVAMRWTEEGCRDISQVRELLDEYSERNANYTAVFREMGFTRSPNPSDKALMDRWFNEMGCSLAEVLNACKATAGLREPTLKYVNKVLENMQLEAGGIDTRSKSIDYSRAKFVDNARPRPEENTNTTAMVSNKVLDDYYEYIRNESEKIQNAHIDEVCSKHEDIRGIFEVENQLNTALLSGTLRNNSKENKAAIRAQRKELEADKIELLQYYGYPADYLERKYKCNECRDIGSTDEGRICVCRKARADEAYRWYQTIKKN